ncbi:RPL6 [Symbiodinium sp. KB8]|nr:RPL6 [Symbiodinium sp. KB8]
MPRSAAVEKRSRFYPADDVRTPLNRNFTPKPTKLRASITPGTVLIVLAGRFRGKRVVFLKQLESGLLLVTGPFSVNGVPLRRLNQVYAIATELKLDVSGVKLPESVNDSFFKKTKAAKGKKSEADFMAQGAAAAGPVVTDEKKSIQKAVDAAIEGALGADEKAYLKSLFSLSKHDKPHEMKF